MISVTWVTILMGALALLVFGAWAVMSWAIHRAKPADLAWRGIVKLVSLNGVPASLAAIYPRWFALLVTFFIMGSLFVAMLVWASDHSFFVIIFPLLFYYFFARYFFWEKADLAD